MNSGKLRRVIRVQRSTTGANEFGTPTEVWEDHKRLRAEVVERDASEFINAQGAVDVERIVFRTRFVEDVTAKDSILFGSDRSNIREISETGRRTGLELRCAKIGEDDA
ncbi:phage head closure protein [Tropicibacter sp. Alg240-R139]|uniref:phage head closure protein n=1 Tax=Tropicibacter sp. Alg240-R139 TaxID=2305991 RepID=UPI0013DFFD5A|nr:phage head closure protein [Tropicibacter sp. Alg240-R139]